MDWYDPFNPYWMQLAEQFMQRAQMEDFNLTALEREILAQSGMSVQDLTTPSGQIAFAMWQDLLNAQGAGQNPNLFADYIPPEEAIRQEKDPMDEKDRVTDQTPTAEEQAARGEGEVEAENVFTPPPWDTRKSVEENVAAIQDAATKWNAGQIAGGIADKYAKEHKQNYPEYYPAEETPAPAQSAYTNPGEFYGQAFAEKLGQRGFGGDTYANVTGNMNDLYALYGHTGNAAGAKQFSEDLYRKMGLNVSQTSYPSGQIGGYTQPLMNRSGDNAMSERHLYYLTRKKAMEVANPYDPRLKHQGMLKEQLYKEYNDLYGGM